MIDKNYIENSRKNDKFLLVQKYITVNKYWKVLDSIKIIIIRMIFCTDIFI